MVDASVAETLTTSTGELLYQVASVIISAGIAMAAVYIRNWVKTSEAAKKYQLDNDITERVLSNAVVYAEEQGKLLVKDGLEKRKFAIEYIEKVKPELIQEYGNGLEVMVDRKVAELKEFK